MDYIYGKIKNTLMDLNNIKSLTLLTCTEDFKPIETLVIGDYYLELEVYDSEIKIYCDLSALNEDKQFILNTISNSCKEILEQLNKEHINVSEQIDKINEQLKQIVTYIDRNVENIKQEISTVSFNLQQEKEERINDISKLTSDLATEKTRVNSMINQLNSNINYIINQLNNNVFNSIKALNEIISTEIYNRQKADEDLLKKTEADKQELNNTILDTKTILEQADASLLEKLKEETSLRTSNDAVLQSNIDAEERKRLEEDTKLSERIDNLDLSTGQEVSDLREVLNKEIDDRQQAETTLSANIATISSSLKSYQNKTDTHLKTIDTYVASSNSRISTLEKGNMVYNGSREDFINDLYSGTKLSNGNYISNNDYISVFIRNAENKKEFLKYNFYLEAGTHNIIYENGDVLTTFSIGQSGNYNIYFQPDGNSAWGGEKYYITPTSTQQIAPTRSVLSNRYYLKGTMNNWQEDLPMYQENNQVRYWGIYLPAATEFKINNVETGKWYPEHNNYVINNNRFVDITFDISTGGISVTESAFSPYYIDKVTKGFRATVHLEDAVLFDIDGITRYTIDKGGNKITTNIEQLIEQNKQDVDNGLASVTASVSTIASQITTLSDGLIQANETLNTLSSRVDAITTSTSDTLSVISGRVDDLESDYTTLSQELTNISTAINNEVTARTQQDTEIQTNLSNHTSDENNPHNVTKAQVGLGSVVNTGDSTTPVENGTTKFTTGGAYNLKTDLESKINTEKSQRESADTTLQSNIDVEAQERQEVVSTLTNRIAAEEVRAAAEEANLDKEIKAEAGERIQADNVLSQRVDNLEGKTTRLFYGEGTLSSPTAAEIKAFVDEQEVEPPYTAPYSGIAVVVKLTDENTYHIWHYYTNLSSWKDDGVDLVSTFTNTTKGIIQGTTSAGYISAENGFGKVNGWTELNSTISNNYSTLDAKINSLSTDLNDKILAEETRATAEEAVLNDAINTKYDKAGGTISGNTNITGTLTIGSTSFSTVSSAEVLGNTKSVLQINGQLYAKNGIVFGGTASAAGLVTRGICGIDTPVESNGSLSQVTKDSLYLNYDVDDNSYSRKVILGAGSLGSDLGHGIYSYTAVRGDQLASYVNGVSSEINSSISNINNTISSISTEIQSIKDDLATITGLAYDDLGEI